jgi:hypothetical protein
MCEKDRTDHMLTTQNPEKCLTTFLAGVSITPGKLGADWGKQLFVRWVFGAWDGKGVSEGEGDSNEVKI